MKRTCALASTAVLAALTVSAADLAYMMGRKFAVSDYSAGLVRVVEPDGSISRTEKNAPESNDLSLLPNGNLLFTTGYGAREVDPSGKIVWEYKTASQVYATQRLPDGNTFVGECSTGKLLTIAPDGKTVVKSISLLPDNKGYHLYFRNARVLANGHYLVAHLHDQKVVEYDGEGKVVWECKTPGGPHSVERLPNGNTMVACGDNGEPCVVELAPDKSIVWKLGNDDLPGRPLRFMTGFVRLRNGNLLVSNWVGHNLKGNAALPHLFEVTREKKVVWIYNDHDAFKTIANIQVY